MSRQTGDASSSPAVGARALLTTDAIRERCGRILEAGIAGRLKHFEVHLDALDAIAERVVATTKERYPDLDIPYHSRWGHLRVGGVDRVADFEQRITDCDPMEQGRKRFELIIPSVLLDAGAGKSWTYREGRADYGRSEGLAVASYHLFTSGELSSQKADPLRADADGLAGFEADTLREAFHVRDDNPLVGVEGRADLLQRLGSAIVEQEEIFGPDGRLGGLFDYLVAEAGDARRLPATRVLDAVLRGLGSIWPGRTQVAGVDLGDSWRHPEAGGDGDLEGIVPFHKLSQWLSYSLLEPLERAGIEVVDLDALTGLAEYRNGGLFIDGGALVPKYSAVLGEPHAPDSEVVVEWRALTVALLDRLAPMVRDRLGLDASSFPLAKVLEGGTWHAGREIARERREDGTPPLRIESDGTVF